MQSIVSSFRYHTRHVLEVNFQFKINTEKSGIRATHELVKFYTAPNSTIVQMLVLHSQLERLCGVNLSQ